MVHSPPLAKHLAVFQLEKESDNPFDLGCLLGFKETLADCDDPCEKMALKKHFPKGLRSRLLLDLEFLGAGMGGCGGIEIGVLYVPHSGTELLCWFDLENSEGKVLASLVYDRSPWFGPELVRLALKSLGDAVVCNSALSTVENLLPLSAVAQAHSEPDVGGELSH